MGILDNYFQTGISRTAPTVDPAAGWEWQTLQGFDPKTDAFSRAREGQTLWYQTPIGMDTGAQQKFERALSRGWQGHQVPTRTRRRDGRVVNQQFSDPAKLRDVDFAKYLAPYESGAQGPWYAVPHPGLLDIPPPQAVTPDYPPGQLYQPPGDAGLYPNRFNIGDAGLLGQPVEFPGGNEWYPESFGGRSPYAYQPMIQTGLLQPPKPKRTAPQMREFTALPGAYVPPPPAMTAPLPTETQPKPYQWDPRTYNY